MNAEPTSSNSGSRTRELFLACLEQPAGEPRQQFLKSASVGDSVLFRSVDELLAFHVDDGFMECPAVQVSRPDAVMAAGPQLGSWIGRYRLEREIGSGGCGMVFAAQQNFPVRRRVALKIIKPGMDSRAVIARFEVERQALALMEHPHIARVLDAGTTPTGQPFFAMEFVEGVSITRFADEDRLSVDERLRLFLRVAAAMEHAHERHIIHRDLKPSNILVTRQDGEPWPRIIDFGVAKAVGLQLDGLNTFTVPGLMLGTPAYMSPEQADLRPGEVDRRSDVYSLGALLHELLVGVPPFDPQQLAAGGIDAMRRTIREQDPPPPSVALARQAAPVREAAAACRGTTPGRLARDLGRDADWIVLRALEKDPERRYPSAAEFAADVRRLLEHEPVRARPPGRIYRFRKLLRRRPLLFATVAAFLLPLLLGAPLLRWQLRETADARQREVFASREEQLQRGRLERAREDEARLRQQAERLSQLSWRPAYAADLNLAQQALAANNLGRAVALLDLHRPGPAQPDLRGWEWRYLWQQTRSEAEFTLGRLTNEVRNLSLSADGRWLASVDGSDAVSVWEVASRRRTLLPDASRVAMVRFSPVSSVMAYFVRREGRAAQGEVLVWDAELGRPLTRLRLAGTPAGLAFSGDGQQLLTATTEGELERWNLASGRRAGRTVVPPIRGWEPTFAASPDLSRVAYVGADERLVWLDARTGEVLWKSAETVRGLRMLVLSPDGAMLVAATGVSGGGVVRRWATNDGRELPALSGHSAWVADVAFLPDGSRLVSAGADQTLRVWDAADGRLLRTLRGHRIEVWCLAISADGQRVFSGGKDGELNAWDLRRPAPASGVLALPGKVRYWGFSADDGALVAVDDQGRVRRWDHARNPARTELFQVGPTRLGGTLSADGRWFAAGVRNGGLVVWNLRTGQRLVEIGSGTDFRVPVALLPATTNLITLQPKEHTYTRWSLPEGKAMETWPANPGFRGFNFAAAREPTSDSPGWFASVSSAGQADLRSLSAGRMSPVELGLRQITGVALDPAGHLLAVSSAAGRAALWQLDPPRRVAEFGGFLLGTHSVAFSPDGERLAVGSHGREGVKIFDPVNQMELLTLDSEVNRPMSTVRFSPDGRWLGASSPDGTLRLWSAPTFGEIAEEEVPGR